MTTMNSDEREVHRNYECMTTVADETLWCPTCAARAEYLRGYATATTRMRDLCVEKVKEVAVEAGIPRHGEWTVNANDILAALESLTLDAAANQVEQKEAKESR